MDSFITYYHCQKSLQAANRNAIAFWVIRTLKYEKKKRSKMESLDTARKSLAVFTLKRKNRKARGE